MRLKKNKMKQLELFETKEVKPPIELRRQDISNLVYTLFKSDQEDLYIGLNEYSALKNLSEYINVYDLMVFAKNARIQHLEATLRNGLNEFNNEIKDLNLYSLFKKFRDNSSYRKYNTTINDLKKPLTKKGDKQIEGELIAAEAIIKYGLGRGNVKKGSKKIENLDSQTIQNLKNKLYLPAIVYCEEKDYEFYKEKYNSARLPYHIEVRPLIPTFKGTQDERNIKKGRHFAKKSSEILMNYLTKAYSDIIIKT